MAISPQRAAGKTVGHLTPAQLHARLLRPDPAARLLAEVLCAVYWGGDSGVNLQQLENLGDDDWTLLTNILRYRRSPLWSEEQFHLVACWCREHFALQRWVHED